MKQLGEVTRSVLRFIDAQQEEHGYTPTHREISDNFGWGSSNSASHHVNKLKKRGVLESRPHAPRSLRRKEK